jgi:hypothetical protein
MDRRLLIVGLVVLAVSVIALSIIQTEISQLAADRDALGGLSGAGQDLTDALGITDYEGQRDRLVALRGVAIGGIVVGIGLMLFGRSRNKST